MNGLSTVTDIAERKPLELVEIPPLPRPAGILQYFEAWCTFHSKAIGFVRKTPVFTQAQLEERDRMWVSQILAAKNAQ